MPRASKCSKPARTTSTCPPSPNCGGTTAWSSPACSTCSPRKLDDDPELSKFSDYVEDLGTGRWAVLEAIDRNVPAPAMTAALLTRLRSRQETSFGGQVLSALREEFGGHVVNRPNGPVA